MNRVRIDSLFLLLALVASLGAPPARALPAQDPPSPVDGPVVVRFYVRDRDHLNAVAGELDIWEAHPQDSYVVAAVTPAQYAWLESRGYRLEIDAEKTALLAISAALDSRFYHFDDYYPNDNDRYVVDFVQEVNAAYPDLTELYDIGDAWMAGQPGEYDRDIWVLRLTNEDPAYGLIEDKPAFFLMASMHAREVATPELAIRYIKYLTTGYNPSTSSEQSGEGGYGLDPDVTWLMNHNVAYVLVMQNPDGHWKNEQDTGNNRRKNMDWDDGCTNPASWGVDLNRNHSFLWGCCGGSSGSPCVETYRGPSQGSEPETQAFQNYFTTVIEDQNGPNGDDEIPSAAPDDTTGIFISLHGYSDLVLWPWGFDNYGDPPNYAQLRTIGRKFAYYNGYDPSGTIWYDVDGATDDWTYGKFGIPSFTFEVGPSGGACGGFFPAYGCLDGIDGQPRNFWAENKPAFLFAHKIARTPYTTAYGPDAEDLVVAPAEVLQGALVQLTATIADHRYGSEPLQPIVAAEYFVDAPGEDGTGIAMAPVDGGWGELSEEVMATVDTSGLAPGQHYLLIHGQNDDGDWGPFTAVFLSVPYVELQLSKAATPNPVSPGGLLTYTLRLTNSSVVPATGLAVSDTLPTHTVFAWSSDGGAVTDSLVTWRVPSLAPSAVLSLTLVVTVGDVADGTPIVNADYDAWCDQSPTVVQSGPVTVTVAGVAVSQVTFDYTPSLPRAGHPVVFTTAYTPTNATLPVLVTWSFSEAGLQATRVFSPAGQYTVAVTATNAYGWATFDRSIIVTAYDFYLPLIVR